MGREMNLVPGWDFAPEQGFEYQLYDFKSKVLADLVTDLSAWVGFCISTPTAECQISTLVLFYFEWGCWEGRYKYIMQNFQLTEKFFLSCKSKVLHRPLTNFSPWILYIKPTTRS